MENYYNLINGYKRSFLNPTYTGSDESYLSGAKFEEVASLSFTCVTKEKLLVNCFII